jgi:integrase
MAQLRRTFKNKKVCLFARLQRDGKQIAVKVKRSGNAAIVPVPDAVYWLSWPYQDKQKYLRVGRDHREAVAAQLQQESFLAEQRFNLQAEAAMPVRKSVADAIAEFLGEKPDPVKRTEWARQLKIFTDVVRRHYLDEITRSDIFKFMDHWRVARGASRRTVFNRTVDLGTFLRHAKVVPGLNFRFTKGVKGDIPPFVPKPVDFYEARELEPLFAACDPEAKMVFQFFLKTGAREREVTFATWADIDFAKQTFSVTPKEDLGFTPKSMKGRSIPLDDQFVADLRAYRQLHPDRRFERRPTHLLLLR